MGDRIEPDQTTPRAFREGEGLDYRDALIASGAHPGIVEPEDSDFDVPDEYGCAGVYVESDDPHYTMEGRDG